MSGCIAKIGAQSNQAHRLGKYVFLTRRAMQTCVHNIHPSVYCIRQNIQKCHIKYGCDNNQQQISCKLS